MIFWLKWKLKIQVIQFVSHTAMVCWGFQGSHSYRVGTFLIWTISEFFLSLSVVSHPLLIGCYKSYDTRIIETLICLESSHWLNLMWHHSTVSRPNASTSLVTSVNASMASTKELPKCALKIIPDTDKLIKWIIVRCQQGQMIQQV